MLSTKSLEILIDLVEIKLGALEAVDVHDRKTMRELEICRKQLAQLRNRPQPAGTFAAAA